MSQNVNTLSVILEKVAYLEAQNTAKEARIVELERRIATATQNSEIERLTGTLTAIRADIDIVRETSSGVAVRVTALEGKRAKGK